MTVEEVEIQQNCGCGQDIVVIDNPTQSQTTLSDINELTDAQKKENEWIHVQSHLLGIDSGFSMVHVENMYKGIR